MTLWWLLLRRLLERLLPGRRPLPAGMSARTAVAPSWVWSPI
ncbi:hypothetical protein ACWDPF_33925 [Streptomyces albogriseolus]